MDKQDSDRIVKEKSPAQSVLYPAYGELFKPTAIHGAVMGNITGFKEREPLYFDNEGNPVEILTQMITFSRNLLRIYNVEMTVRQGKTGEKTNDLKIVLLNDYPLFGEIKKVNLIENPLDMGKKLILVLFDENRLSTLAVDPLTLCLQTVDLHNFENPETEILKKGQKIFSENPKLKIDPFQRAIGNKIELGKSFRIAYLTRYAYPDILEKGL